MKTLFRSRRIWWSLASGLLVVGMVTAALAFVPVAPAYADDGNPPTTSPERSRDRGTVLERIFEKEKDWLDRQAANLDRANEMANKLGTLIEKAKANGKDVSELEAALAEFNSQIAVAEGQHETAASIIDEHAGFNGGGKVMDEKQALETVKSAGTALRDAAQTLRDAAEDLRQAVRQWREENKPVAAPSPAG